VDDETLVIGPYQGTHGCLRIAFDRGVCGAAARTKETQLVDDVDEFPGHIACSETTRSEIVVPILRRDGSLLGVLDVDSNDPAAFTRDDAAALEDLCAMLGARFG
jgi:GAF domain-containing protein